MNQYQSMDYASGGDVNAQQQGQQYASASVDGGGTQPTALGYPLPPVSTGTAAPGPAGSADPFFIKRSPYSELLQFHPQQRQDGYSHSTMQDYPLPADIFTGSAGDTAGILDENVNLGAMGVGGESPNQGLLFHAYANIANRPNQHYSLEQSRFISRLKRASRQMDTFYLQELAKKKQAEKEKYIHYLESQAQLNFGEDTRHMSSENPFYRQQLGRTVAQVEMNNAQLQKEMKEILEAQIREKDYTMQKAYQVKDVGFRDMKLHKSKILGGLLDGALGQYCNPELLAAQNDALLN